MTKVVLHVYDVTTGCSTNTKNVVLELNCILKDRIGLGGIFHSAVQVYGDEEWSFGYCEEGPGVFSYPRGRNPMFTYRECIVLGETNCSTHRVEQILRELRRHWTGDSYDLLSRNCNHFCEEFCKKLGVTNFPVWLNRLATVADTAMDLAGNAAVQLRNASKSAYKFLVGAGLISPATLGSSSSAYKGPFRSENILKNLSYHSCKLSKSTASEFHRIED